MTNEELIDRVRRDARTLERRARRAGTELSGMGVAQRSAVTSDGSSCGGNQDDWRGRSHSGIVHNNAAPDRIRRRVNQAQVGLQPDDYLLIAGRCEPCGFCDSPCAAARPLSTSRISAGRLNVIPTVFPLPVICSELSIASICLF